MPRSNDIFKEFKRTVLEDSEFSLDEMNLLENIMANVRRYNLVMSHAAKDGKINAAEKKLLEKTRNKIWADAQEMAASDTVITQEEEALLSKLASVLAKLEEKE